MTPGLEPLEVVRDDSLCSLGWRMFRPVSDSAESGDFSRSEGPLCEDWLAQRAFYVWGDGAGEQVGGWLMGSCGRAGNSVIVRANPHTVTLPGTESIVLTLSDRHCASQSSHDDTARTR